MLSIDTFREEPDLIKKSESKRGKDPSLVDKVVKYDKKWRKVLKEAQELKYTRNVVSKKISKLKKEGKSAKNKISRMKKVNKKIEKLDSKAEKLLKKRESYRYKIGNLLRKEVPKGGEEESKTLRTWGKPPEFEFEVKNHVDLMKNLDLADFDKAGEVVGSRFYYLKNELTTLNFSMLRYAMDKMMEEGFIPIWTPFMLNRQALKKAAPLKDFEEVSYKIEDEDLYLISTAEQTLANLHFNEVIPKEKLPLAYSGYSTNFRKEAGTHGKYSKGLFRIHQFDKVEQYVFCKAENSKKWHEKLIKITEEIFKGLDIPYKIVCLGSDDTNDNASITYDLKGWFPSEEKYFELASDSDCTDYQARKLNIRYGKMGGNKEMVNTLNNTALATERTMCALLENHQKKDGSIKVPKKLQKYTGFKVIK